MVLNRKEHHSRLWERFAKDDPLYSILSDDTRQDGGWELADFFSTGEKLLYPELQEIVDGYGASTGTALDFGCGVGRLTRCLLKYFENVHGIDVSTEMIRQAKRINPDAAHITFVDKSEPDLKVYKDSCFDFVLSLIVIQHIPKKYILKYLDSIVRITKSGGLIFIQIPAKELVYRNKPVDFDHPGFLKKRYRMVSRYLKTHWRSWTMQTGAFKKENETYFLMSCIKPEVIFSFFEKRNCKIIRLREDYSAGDNFLSYDYLVRKL